MIIVGLGNPLKKYEKTRHNVGFNFVNSVAKANNVDFKLNKDLLCMYAEFITNINQKLEKHLLIKPTTYMNNSGLCVEKVLNYYKEDVENLIVIYDDMDLSTGIIRIRKFGSSGGHNGMKSIISQIGSEDFKRIRIGIGHPHDNEIDYVLGKFGKEEGKLIQEVYDQAPNIINDLILNGIDYIMNNYNS